MSVSTTTTVLFTLPPTFLTFRPQPPQISSTSELASSSILRPQLRLKISVDLLIPSPPISVKPHGRKVEDVVDVVVPVGGKVGMDVRVEEEGLSMISGIETEMDGYVVKDQLRDRIRVTLLEVSFHPLQIEEIGRT